MEKIAVLLSAYNGEKYLAEQIDSLLAQEGVELNIYIRDDGSTDNTAEIISAYEAKNRNIKFINREDRRNVGFNQSFYALIRYAIENINDTDLYAFCDQDDVWMKDKLSSAIKKITERLTEKQKDLSTPLYYYANKYWTDEKLNIVHEDNMQFCRDEYFDMLMLPPVYGCTSVINRALCELTLNPEPPKDLLYDVYMFRLACMVDSVIISDRLPHMFYRRHGNNASGDAMKFSPIKRVVNLITGKRSFHGIQNYVSKIVELHRHDISPEQLRFCKLICNYDKSLGEKWKLLFWHKAYTRGVKTSVIWIGRVLCNAI